MLATNGQGELESTDPTAGAIRIAHACMHPEPLYGRRLGANKLELNDAAGTVPCAAEASAVLHGP